jgi:hypothetical protein
MTSGFGFGGTGMQHGTDTIESSGGRKAEAVQRLAEMLDRAGQPDHAEPGDRLGIVGRLRQDPGQGLLTLLERAGIEILLVSSTGVAAAAGTAARPRCRASAAPTRPDSHSAEK